MKHSFFISLSAFVFCLAAGAKVEVLAPIKVESEVPAWNLKYAATINAMENAKTYPSEGYTECREVVEIQQAFLCVSNSMTEMNQALARASFFIEGLGDNSNKGKVLPHNNPSVVEYMFLLGGHDLKGEDLLRYHKQVSSECVIHKNDPNICFNKAEKDLFENFILPQATKNKNFVVITFPIRSISPWREIVTHEIMHAQYFNQPVFRQVVDDFWQNEVPESDKQKVRLMLGSYYDNSDEFLMKNEFQAYILMTGAEDSLLSYLVPVYRESLMKRMADKGVRPVQVP